MSYLVLGAASDVVTLWFISLVILIAFGLLFYREARRMRDVAEALKEISRRMQGSARPADRPGEKE
jgi:hypothetical protein